jgi:thioester reductase-like protein
VSTSDVVLLTGYPSMLARSVAREVLAADDAAKVTAVVRGKFFEEAKQSRDELPADERKRLSFLEGDAAAIDLGLSGAEWRTLTRTVTRIHHCAQVTYLGVDRKTAERLNVDGTLEVVELARSCASLRALVLHSTAHVSGNRRGLVLEDELRHGQSFRTVVEETKARAEIVARDAMGKLPIVVVRPSTIVGHSETGEVDRFDGPYLLVLLVVTSPPELAIPLPGRGDEPLNLVPIDWVARAAVALGRDETALGKTFHLVDPDPPSARRAFELVARAGGRRDPRGSIPANLAKALLRAPGLDRIAKSPRAFLETLTTRVVYDARNTQAHLPALGVPGCPSFESYVDKLVEYVQERVRQRRQTRREEVEAPDPLG